MLRLLRQRLDALADPLDPGFGFDLIRLEAILAEETRPATISFDSNENARRQIGFLVDRLAARFGDARVQRFVPQDTHIPEAESAAVPAQDDDFGEQDWRMETAVRRSAAPAFAAVWKSRKKFPCPCRRCRMVRRCAFAGGGWSSRSPAPKAPSASPWNGGNGRPRERERPKKNRLTRDYFRVETRDGQRFWLYRDGLYRQNGFAPRWYLQGLFA